MAEIVQITVFQAMEQYLGSVKLARSERTARTYKNGMNALCGALLKHNIDPEIKLLNDLSEDAVTWLAEYLKELAPTTERLYLTATVGFFEYLAAENLINVNLPRIHLLIRQRARRPGVRLPTFPSGDIDNILTYMINNTNIPPASEENERLIFLRDRAFLVTLADTGLRVHEACGLHRGDIDWMEGRAVVIGKGNRQDVVRFSQRSMKCLQDYLHARAHIDGLTGKALSSLSLFARHDPGSGKKKIKAMTTTTGRNIVRERVIQIIGEEAVGTITPHSFRHYFVTRVLKASGNLKLAQSLARHKNIAVTQRYAHLNDDELDRGYHEIFENRE